MITNVFIGASNFPGYGFFSRKILKFLKLFENYSDPDSD